MLGMMFNKVKRCFNVSKTDWLFIAAGLVVFAVITFWTITKSSIWFDESFGAYMIQFNFIDIASYTASDVHPPLYYWLLKLWTMIFGNTEIGIRSMSVLFGGVSIIFGYLLTHRLFGKKAARISLIFMVISPMLVRYGQEARMYTLVTAIGLAATYVLTFAVETKKKLPWVIYGILVSLGMWTHYYSAIVWISHWIWRADVVRRVAKKGRFIKSYFSKEWILAHAVAIVIFLPWIWLFICQMFVVQAFGFWIPKVTPDTPINFLTNVIYYQDSTNVNGWMALGFWAMVTLMGILSFRVYKTLNDDQRQSYRLIASLAFVPILLLILLSMPPLRPSFVDRYLITSIVGIMIFIGTTLAFGVKLYRTVWQISAMTLYVAFLMVIGVSNVWHFGNYNKNTHNSSGARQIVQVAVSHSSDNQPIIASSPWMYYESVFYSTPSHPVYYFELINYPYGSLSMLKYNDRNKIKDISAFAKDNPIIWYIGYIGTSGELKVPYSNWEELQKYKINDPIKGTPEYEAIQYRISAN